MNLRGLANSVTRQVNPNEVVTVQRSTGFTVGAGHKQVPQYAAGVVGAAQIQALDGKDLEQLDDVSQQGDLRAMYWQGELSGINRPLQTGGDLVKRDDGSLWLVTKVLETWGLWTKVAITRQMPTNRSEEHTSELQSQR